MKVPSESLLARHAPLRAVEGCGGLVAHQADDLVELGEQWEREGGERQETPFWGVVWPAGRVLAARILSGDIEVRDRTVLDLGCGGAIGAMAAAARGAREAIANDTDPVALHVARRNARANGLALTCSSEDYISGGRVPSADIMLVADMFYERSIARRTARLLKTARERGTRVFVADAERTYTPRDDMSRMSTEEVEVSADVEGVAQRTVGVYSVP
jgi:predicted nicotinamide N-methyase